MCIRDSQYDMEYDNLIMASMRGRAGQVMGGGFSGGKAQLGVRTTKAVKTIGCSNLKQLVESDKITYGNDLKITIEDIKQGYKKWLKEYMIN